MGIAPSEFRVFVAFELMVCLLLRTAYSARMDCVNYCRHVNSGNVPYQAQMYGACGCDYQPYYSNPVPKYNYAPSYRPRYPMLQVQDQSTTVRTIPFNQQPDNTGIYYIPAEMKWPQNYQNFYANNGFFNSDQTQNVPRGKLVFIPEVSPETKYYNNFDFNIHQTAHIDARPAYIDGQATDMMRANDDNIDTYAPSAPDDRDHHRHRYMDLGFRNLLSKNHSKQDKAKETLFSLNMTANEHHFKKCLELTNLVKSRILNKEDEQKGNKTLLYKYKHLSNEAINDEINKSCQHSSDVLEKDVKTIKTMRRPAAKIVNNEHILEKPSPPTMNGTVISDDSESLHTPKITTNNPRGIIEDRSENEREENGTESIENVDKVNLKNEEKYIDNVTNSPTDINVTEDLSQNESTVSLAAPKSADEEVTDKIKNNHTNCTVNSNTNLQKFFNGTESTHKIDSNHENPTTATDWDIQINDTTNLSSTMKSIDNEDESKEMRIDDSAKINNTNNPIKSTDHRGNSIVTDINGSLVNATMITDEDGSTRVPGFDDSVKINNTHVNATMATNEEHITRDISINESIKINSTRVNSTMGTGEEGNVSKMGINDRLKMNDTHVDATMPIDNVRNASVVDINEVSENQLMPTTLAFNSEDNVGANLSTDNVHTTETTLPKLELDNDAIYTTPVMETYEPDFYPSNETDSSDDNNKGILRVNPKETGTAEVVSDDTFKLPQNNSEVVKEIANSAIINEIPINKKKTTEETDEENSTLMRFDDIIMSTTPAMHIDEINIYTTNKTDNSNNENIEVSMNTSLKNSTVVKNEKLKLPLNKPDGLKSFNDSATTKDDHINITDKNFTSIELNHIFVTPTSVTDLSELSTSHENDGDENNEVVIKAHKKETQISKEVNDEKFNVSQNHTELKKEFDNSDLNRMTNEMNKNKTNLGFDDADTTITPTTDTNKFGTHKTESSNEDNEAILKKKPNEPQTSLVNDKQFRFSQDKSEATVEFDDSLQVIPLTENFVNSNKNENDTKMNDVTMKTADNLIITDKKSESNFNPTVSTMDREATQSLDDINSIVSRNDTEVTPLNFMSPESQHAISESDNNETAKSFEESDNITLPPFGPRMKVGKSAKKSKLGMELDMNDKIDTNITTFPSIEITPTEPTKTTMAITNGWETKPSDGLNPLINIKTIHQSKKGKEKKNKTLETDKDNKLILVKMLPPVNVQDNNFNDVSETKEADLNNDDETSEFAISTFETPYNMFTNAGTIDRGDDDLNETQSDFSFRRYSGRKKIKPEFNEKQKLLQNSFPNTTNSNHTIQSTKRHTTIVADSQENMNSRQYVATTNNPIKNINKDNRRSNNETRNKIMLNQKRIPENERIVSNIFTQETNKGIVNSMKDELVTSDEQGYSIDGDASATVQSVYTDESVTDIGDYADDIPVHNNGHIHINTTSEEVIGEQNTLKQSINSEYLPTESSHPDGGLLSDLSKPKPPPDSLYSQPILTGKMYFVQNGTNLVPLKFIQKSNGNVALGIDGNFICKNLLNSLNDTSVLLSVLCNEKIPTIPDNNCTSITSHKTPM